MNNKDRIIKALDYFESIPPSQFNAAHFTHLKTFFKLFREYLGERSVVQTAKEIMGVDQTINK